MLVKFILKLGMLAVNIVAIVAMLIAMIGAVVSPEYFMLPAYFTLVFPIIVIVNIGFVLFWIILRKWFFLLSLGVLLLFSKQVNSTFPIHIGKKATTTQTFPINILTYNMKMGGELKKHTTQKPNKVIQYILDADPDIVCLQEFAVVQNKNYTTQMDMMDIFEKYPYKHIQYANNNLLYHIGVATFSKYPIVNKQKIQYISLHNLSIFSDININGKLVRLINNHLESNRLTEREKHLPVELKKNFNTENLSKTTLLFTSKLSVAYKIRAKQADAIAKIIDESPYTVIVCGDFNDIPTSYTYNTIKGKLSDAFTETGTGFGHTFRHQFYRFRIDYVLYDSTAFSPIRYTIDKVKFSDHYPVLCELNMK